MAEESTFRRFGEEPREVEGIYKGYRRSFGFIVGPDLTEDVYIAAENKHGAMHNDKVRARIITGGYGSRKKEGEITSILERANETIVGTYDRQKQFGFVKPDDERIGEDIYVPLEEAGDARSGAKVLVEITKWPEERRHAEGKITQVLGYEGDVGLDINCIMAQHKIPFAFPDDVLAESRHIDMAVVPGNNRLDLRQQQLVTIDGEDAKDLDDAVSLTMLPSGNYELGVHIADVSNYVIPRSAIDKEAYKRGTSVYLVDRVVPMLPEVLSNGICSLNAREDRYAMSCIMEIDGEGKVIRFKISPSIINVGRRCNYREVYQALEEDIVPENLQPYMTMLRQLKELSEILIRMRSRAGALDFDFPEYKVLLDREGTPLRIVRRDRTIAERMIEQCMLIANETVATFLRDTNEPSVYRIHEKPSEEKLSTLQTVVNYLGHSLNLVGDNIEPRQIQAFLKSVEGTDVERVAQVMTLRSMQQARYSAENEGHFGLASECYTHFTSPIRRYPDLMIHRLLKKALHWGSGYIERDLKEIHLARAAEHCSVMEQVAVEAERDTNDLKKVQYMLPFVGQVFAGQISSITSFGMFVELENGIDGLVHIAAMDDDYYFFDEEHFLLVGRRTGTTYHLGQEVTVTLARVDLDRKQIDFVLGEITDLQELQRRIARPSREKAGDKGMKKGKEKGGSKQSSGSFGSVFNRSKAYGDKGKSPKLSKRNKKDKQKKNKSRGKKK